MSMLTAFRVQLFFHQMNFMSRVVIMKKLSFNRTARTALVYALQTGFAERLGLTIEFLFAYDSLWKSCPLGLPLVVVALYI